MSEQSQHTSDVSRDHDEEGGISPLDLESLPLTTRKIMRLILRKPELTSNDLHAAVEAFPPDERVAPAELATLLDDMVARRWLLRLGSVPDCSYKVNLRRRATRQLNKNVWDALDGLGTPRKRTPRSSDDPADA